MELDQRVPIILKELRKTLDLEEELLDLRARGATDTSLGLVGTSVALQNLRALIQRMATADSREPFPVLVQGSTGSGKELVAQAIHKLGPHPADPFFDVNCGALAETLIEDQLFGHVRGAFTDAHKDQDGYFSLVRRGTLFLDEVAELSLSLQMKLLRVQEIRRFRPVGPTAREQHFQGRIVAATHVDLKQRVRENRFREDLFHRLNVLPIHVPSLSDHREDIPALVQHFTAQQHKPMQFTQRAIEQLSRRPWPGNVRELRNAITRSAILADSERIDVDTLERYLPLESEGPLGDALSSGLTHLVQKVLALPLENRLDATLDALVLAAVEQTGGTNTEAGKLLGRSRKFVERYLKKLAKRGKDTPPEDSDS
jgi:DNA-binding NtrC family response regulator